MTFDSAVSSSSSISFMNESDLDDMFNHFLRERNIKDASAHIMMSMSSEHKQRMLILDSQSNWENRTLGYIEYLRLIKKKKCIYKKQPSKESKIAELNSLIVHLRYSPIPFLKEFNSEQNNGLALLLAVIRRHMKYPEIVLRCLKCLEIFGNCNYGLSFIRTTKDILLHIALCLKLDFCDVQLMSVRLLTLVTFYNWESHCNVMEALHLSAQFNEEYERFKPIVQCLAGAIDKKINNLINCCLQFVNVIVSPNFQETNLSNHMTREYSLKLRHDLERCGINQHINHIIRTTACDNIRDNALLFEANNEYENIYENYMNDAQVVKHPADIESTNIEDEDKKFADIMEYLESVGNQSILQRIIKELIHRIDPYGNIFPTILDEAARQQEIKQLQNKIEVLTNDSKDLVAKLNVLESSCQHEAIEPADVPLPPSLPPPPPPPPINHNLSLRCNIKNDIVMKKANWKLLPKTLLHEDSVWTSISRDQLEVDDELKKLKAQFSIKNSKPRTLIFKDPAYNKKKEPKLLNYKQVQKLEISLVFFRAHYDDIIRGILEINDTMNSRTKITNLLSGLPSVDMVTNVGQMMAEYDNLNNVEQFLCKLSTISNWKFRLESILFRYKFDERMNLIRPIIIQVTKTLVDVRNSECLPKILALILKFGNFMNARPDIDISVGFDIDFLTRLVEIKDSENRGTLLDFLTKTISEKFPTLLSVVNELSNVEKVTEVPIEQITKLITESNLMEINLEEELRNYKKQAVNDNYQEIMSKFLLQLKEDNEEISSLKTNLEDAYETVCRYLSIDATSYTIFNFICHIKTFVTEFRKSVKKVEETNIKGPAVKPRLQTNYIQREIPDNKKGILDKMTSDIELGVAFGNLKNRKLLCQNSKYSS